MMSCWWMIALGLIPFFQGQDAIKNEMKECVSGCRRKIKDDISLLQIEDDACNITCLDLLQMGTTNETQAPLLNPGVPTFVSSEFRSIRLVWNATNRSNQSAVRYIVHVNPHRTNQNANITFPYLKKYYVTNETIYTVEKLLAKTRYRFRVAAVTLNETSSFSNWSEILPTNYTCPNPPCSVTNVQLKLNLFKPYKRMTELTGTLYWEPTTGLESYDDYKSLVVVKALPQDGYCNIKFQVNHKFKGEGEKEKLTNKSFSFLHLLEKGSNFKTELHFGCKYRVKIGLIHDLGFGEIASKTWEFHLPKCVDKVCGCKFFRELVRKDTFVHINLTQTSKDTSLLNVTWNNKNWWDGINVTYYRVELKQTKYTTHVDAMDHIQEYSKSFSNLTNGETYILEIAAFHSDSCIHEKIKELKFNVAYPCRNKPCSGNSTCQRDGWLDNFKCDCFPGFRKVNDTICEGVTIQFTESTYNVDENKKPVVEIKVTSGQIASPVTIDVHYIVTTGPSSAGNDDFVPKTHNITFQPRETGPKLIEIDIVDDPIVEPPETFKVSLSTSATSVTVGKPAIVNISDNDEASKHNTGTIIASVISPLVFIIILIVFLLVVYRRRYQKKKLGTLARAMDSMAYTSGNGTATLTNNYDYQHPVTVALPPAKGSFEDDQRELNVLYVPIEIKNAIAKGLTDGIFELSSDRIKLHRVIGKGAFGEVYHGEAHGILDNLGWTVVAVKKLADSATINEIHDFMEEIELIKMLGRHDNVIEMYGCCTLSPPICLIMEFASGGNLLDYLRSLKNKFEKFFEHGEMFNQLDAYSFPCNKPLLKDPTSNNNVKQLEDHSTCCLIAERSGKNRIALPGDVKEQYAFFRTAENVEIATKVNEEIQTALDPKELESFARQIANGMTHVAHLGIIHRDLAARNILLDENKVLKISDFGLSREGIYVKKTGGKIPLRWLSIEAIQERRYSTASDVWAFGIVLWEICTLGDIPYPSVSDGELLPFLRSGQRLKKAASCTDEIYEIMLKCWKYRPQDRPTFTELSEFLWQLEHEGNTYVNIEPLMTAPPSLPPKEAHNRKEDLEQENYKTPLSEPESNPQKSPRGIENLGFWKSTNNLNLDDEQLKQESQIKYEDAENSAEPVSNGVSNRGPDAENSEPNTIEA